MTETAERLNGRVAMIGFMIAVGTYITTGDIIPGILWLMEGAVIGSTLFLALFLMTIFGIWQGFGAPSKSLTDPFDDHDD